MISSRISSTAARLVSDKQLPFARPSVSDQFFVTVTSGVLTEVVSEYSEGYHLRQHPHADGHVCFC